MKTTRIKFLFACVFCFTFHFSYAQGKVAINTDGSAPHASAMLDIKSTTSGLLVPRMSTVERQAIVSPAVGLMVYDSTNHAFYYFTGAGWLELLAGSVDKVVDADGDTRIEVEQSTDEDTIRFTTDGTEYLKMAGGRMEVINTGGSVFLGEGAGKVDDLSNSSIFIGKHSGWTNSTGNYNTAIGAQSLELNTTGFQNTALGYKALRPNNQSYNTAIGAFALYQNTTGSNNTALGSGALYSNQEGFYNTAVGKNALYLNVGGRNNVGIGAGVLFSNFLGHRNAALGYNALYQNTIGNENIAIGVGALHDNTDRSNLVAIGDSALYSNGTGIVDSIDATGNTAIGSKAMYANTTGYHNTATGYEALMGNTSGRYNSAFGYGALYSNTDGRLNTAIGYKSMFFNTTGRFNTGIGFFALHSNTEGLRNTAIGYRSLYSNTTGNSNIGIGSRVLYYNLSGAGNTAIGQYAGFNTLGSGNVFIGYYAGYNEIISNKLYIHNDSSAAPLIYGEFDSSLVKINGRIIVGDNSTASPVIGSIRWNDGTQDFEGYTDAGWKSFTYQGHWGHISSTETSILTGSSGSPGNWFGYSTSISADYAIVGSYGWNVNQGRAYIFHPSGETWVRLDDLIIASDGTMDDRFGWSVCISGSYVVVSAPFHDVGDSTDQGKAYIFYHDGSNWIEQDTLIASDGASGDQFGYSVSISGDYVIVGARLHDTGGNAQQGKAYVFHRSGSIWTEQAILTASDGAESDHFGTSVSISGDYAVVGARYHDTGGNLNQGKAYVFQRSGSSWTEQDSLIASDGAMQDEFGYSVSIAGDYVLVGSPYHDVSGDANRGKAYLFHRSGSNWPEQTMLTASDGVEWSLFGISVSITGDYALVGADGHDIGGVPDRGQAYVYRRSGSSWTEETQFAASDGAQGDRFGGSVSISGQYAIIGAHGHDIGGASNVGEAYIFER